MSHDSTLLQVGPSYVHNKAWLIANFQQTSSSIITYGSKRPAYVQHYGCWKFAGRLLDRVNVP